MKSKQKSSRKWVYIIGIVLLFIISLYLVQFSSEGVAKYNNGYGTFDMKPYNATTIYKVLNNMSTEGFSAVRIYYICDYLFVIAMGTLQVMLSFATFNSAKSKLPGMVLAGIAIARGIFDAIENALLFTIISDFPNQHNQLIKIASLSTKLKMCMIGLWVGLFVSGIVLKVLRRIILKNN